MDDKELQTLLVRWRIWSQSNYDSLSYSSTSIEYKLMNEGMVIRSTGNITIEDVECESLDHAISKMPKRLKKIIKMKYLFKWLNKDAAKALSISMPSYKDRVVQSRMWLCGKLTK